MSDPYKKGKIKERHILDMFLKKHYDAVLIEMFDEDGNEVAQTYLDDGVHKSRPDIDVFASRTTSEVILRVEVKGYGSLQLYDKYWVLPIKESQFESYKRFVQITEVPTKVIFVIGYDDSEFEYEYYWETLENLIGMRKLRGWWKGPRDKRKHMYLFWNPNRLKTGLEGFFDC